MRSIGLVFTLLLWAWPGWAGLEDRLIFSGAACVHGPVITLADLAQAQGQQALAALQRIGSEPLLAAPKFDGARANLSGPKLRDLIQARFGPDLPIMEIPAQIQVQRGGAVVHSQTLRPSIDKILTQALQAHGDEIEIRDYRISDYLFVNSANPFQMRVTPVGTPAPGRISLRLEAVTPSGDVLQSFTGTVFADVWKTVPCAARVLNRGDLLDPTLVTFMRKNMAYMGRPPWDGQGLQLRMTAPVGEGQVIYAHAVEPIPVIQKGQIVTLVYEGRTLKLTVPAESMEDGGIGQVIQVRNVQSKKVVAARVLNADTVQVP